MEVMVNAFMEKYCPLVSHDFPGKSSGLLCIKAVNFRRTSGNGSHIKRMRKASIHPAGAALKFRRCGPRNAPTPPGPGRSPPQCAGSKWEPPGLPPVFPAARRPSPWSRSCPWPGPRSGRRTPAIPLVQTSGGPGTCGRFPRGRPGSAGNLQSFPGARCR